MEPPLALTDVSLRHGGAVWEVAGSGSSGSVPCSGTDKQAIHDHRAELVAEVGKAGIPALVVHHGGAAPGTFVAKELVYAYGMWISPTFHLKVFRAYDALVAAPTKPPAELSRMDLIQIAMDAERERLVLADRAAKVEVRTSALSQEPHRCEPCRLASPGLLADDKPLGLRGKHWLPCSMCHESTSKCSLIAIEDWELLADKMPCCLSLEPRIHAPALQRDPRELCGID